MIMEMTLVCDPSKQLLKTEGHLVHTQEDCFILGLLAAASRHKHLSGCRLQLQRAAPEALLSESWPRKLDPVVSVEECNLQYRPRFSMHSAVLFSAHADFLVRLVTPPPPQPPRPPPTTTQPPPPPPPKACLPFAKHPHILSLEHLLLWLPDAAVIL